MMTVRSAGGARGAGCGLFLPRTKFTHRLQKLQTPSKRMTFLPLGREKDGGSLPLSGPVADVGSLSASALLMPSSTLPAVDIGFAVPGEEATAEREEGPVDDARVSHSGQEKSTPGLCPRRASLTATSGRPGTTLRDPSA